MSAYAVKAILRIDQNNYHAMFYFTFLFIFNSGFERALVSHEGNFPLDKMLFLGISSSAKKGASLSDYRPGH